MKILLTFENALPNRLADAEVFVNTSRALADRVSDACLLVPGERDAVTREGRLTIRRCAAPVRFALLRHLFMVLAFPFRPELRACDLVYTRHMLMGAVALLCRRRVVFDHYRPWGDQLPPLQPFLRWFLRHPRLIVAICHSRLTRRAYLRIGIPAAKLATVHAGFDPALLLPELSRDQARRGLGLSLERPCVVYTGRVNHKKGLDVLLAAARRAPELDFVLVGAEGGTAIEAAARAVANVKLVGFQPQRAMARYLHAADVLVIPPASSPLHVHGSTVLPLKTFLYLGAGKPIVAGATLDNAEVLRDGVNARLVAPDDAEALARALREITRDPRLASTLAAGARASAARCTWAARADRILAAIEARASAPGARAERNPWLLECARWLGHVLRTGRWNMPSGYGRAAHSAQPTAGAR